MQWKGLEIPKESAARMSWRKRCVNDEQAPST
nr:MAG TPA: hypothetical protein [Caudoviricetes sp.]